MKKLFSFVLAAMMAMPMIAEDVVVNFAASDFEGKGTASTGSEVTVTKDGVTFTCDKAYGSQWSVRCYKGSTIIITAETNIKGIEFEFDPNSGNAYDGGLNNLIAVGATSWNSGALASQARLKNIKVTLGEGEFVEPELQEITPEQALEIGMALEDNASTDVKYIVKGYVTYAKEYNEQYKNQDFYMASDAASDSKNNFYAYHTIIDAPGVQVGDYVTVEGRITKYVGESGNPTIEIKDGKATILSTMAIENATVKTKATKVVRDGQLVIVRDGVEYSVLGAQVQ